MSVFGPDPNDMSSAKPTFQTDKRRSSKAKLVQPLEVRLPHLGDATTNVKPKFAPAKRKRR
jgi:hypothetical protein